MKRLIALALTMFALAAVPVAFGDDGTTPPDSTTTTTTTTQDQAHGQRGHRLELLRLRIQLAELRFAKHCGGSSTGASQRCLDFATKVEERLGKLDTNVQAQIAKIQAACSATSTDAKCKNAADRGETEDDRAEVRNPGAASLHQRTQTQRPPPRWQTRLSG